MLRFPHLLRGCIVFAALLAAVRASADESFQLRRGISNIFQHVERSEQVDSVCLCDLIPSFEGGSVDTYPIYLQRFRDLGRNLYPNKNFGLKSFTGKDSLESNPPGSVYGAYRYGRSDATVGNMIWGTRLAFIDWAQSDLDKTEQEILDGVEGAFRKSFPYLDVVFVYAAIPEFVNDYLADKTPPVIALYEKIAEYYGCPSINFAKNAAAHIKVGKMTTADYFKEKKHYRRDDKFPDEPGNAIDQVLFEKFFKAGYEARIDDAAHRLRNKMPAPLSATNYENAGQISYEFGQYDKAVWQEGSPPIPSVPLLRHSLVSSKPGAVFAINFRGSRCGFIDVLANDTADIEYRVSDSPWTLISGAAGKDLEAPIRRNFLNLVQGLDPNVEHRFEIRVAEKQPPSTTPRVARLGVLLIDGVIDNPLEGLKGIDFIDALYARMKPIQYNFPADRWKHLPETMEKLRNGESLRMVLLGDSIMGNTGASQFELLLERAYPKCRVERIMSTRGSTGCAYYKDENRVQSFVLDKNPDLLMIGGISNGTNIEDVRSVIHQVRAKQNPEILLITPVFGSANSAHVKNWTYEIPDDPENYRYKMRKLAEEEKCGFIDLDGPLNQYILDTGSRGWYMKDYVHANDRGSHIIGRLLFEFFKPVE